MSDIGIKLSNASRSALDEVAYKDVFVSLLWARTIPKRRSASVSAPFFDVETVANVLMSSGDDAACLPNVSALADFAVTTFEECDNLVIAAYYAILSYLLQFYASGNEDHLKSAVENFVGAVDDELEASALAVELSNVSVMKRLPVSPADKQLVHVLGRASSRPLGQLI